MRYQFILPILLVALLFQHVSCRDSSKSEGNQDSYNYFGQKLPDSIPVRFAPDYFPEGTHSAPTFSPDGKEVYWSRYHTPEGQNSRYQHIFFSKFENGIWTKPAIASFSGKYHDGSPCFTHDGKGMFFASNRPKLEGQQPSNEYVYDIWFIERNTSGWGEPVWLELNTDKHESMVSVAENGSLYFISNRRGVRGIYDLFVSRPIDGKYSEVSNIGSPITTGNIETSPYVAPDESYLIFSYGNRPEGNGIHISFKKEDNTWSKPVRMGNEINSGSSQRFPGLSHNGDYFFFCKGRGYMYWVNADIIDQYKPDQLK